MDIIRPQLDQVRIEKDGRLPFLLIDAITRAYNYIAASINVATGNIEVIQDIHVNRNILHPASGVPIGSFYFETDRKVIYVCRVVSLANAWVYVGGVMSGLVAARPADLTTTDAGFLFTSTDSLDYRWSGTAWVTLGTVRGGAALTNAGKITKVTAAGTIGESSITDNGSAVTFIEVMEMLVANASINVRTPDNTTAPAIGIFQDQGSIRNYGAYALIKVTTSDYGLVVRKASVDTEIITILNTNGRVGIKNTAPAYAFDVTGDLNVTGVYRQGGTAGITGVAALAPLTALGSPGTLTFTGGIITAYTAPT